MSNELFIKDLDAAEPDGGDNISEGDNQITGIKAAVLGSFTGFEGTTAAPKAVTKTEDEINDLAEKSAAQQIDGSWTFTAQLFVERDAGRGITLSNDTPVGGFKDNGTTFVPLVYVSTLGNGEKAIFGGTNAESQYEGDPHTFQGDVNVEAGISSPGDITGVAGLTVEDDIVSNAGNVSANTGEVRGSTVRGTHKFDNYVGNPPSGTPNGQIAVFDGAGVSQGFLNVFPST